LQRGRHRPERLSQEPLDAVALDGAPHPSTDGDAEAWHRVGVSGPFGDVTAARDAGVRGPAREGVEDQMARAERAPLPKYAVEVGAARQPPAAAPATALALAVGAHGLRG
jgi:hypothetical protein